VSPHESRRFTDREVALVLRAAAEIDEAEDAGAGGGLSLEDLRGIAHEVGISPEAVTRAVARLDRRRSPASWLGGAPLVRRAVHAVPGELDRSVLGRLVRLVDERSAGTGAVTEALGSVRWTSSDRLHSTQVSLTPAHGETTLQVVEKARPRVRRLFHLLPMAWGAMIAGPLAASIGPAGGLAVVGALVLGVTGGGALGRLAWHALSRASARRVERLAAELAREATRWSSAGRPGRTAQEDRTQGR
jgi:hypothetical protein